MPILTVLLGAPASDTLARDVADDLLRLTHDILGKRRDRTAIALQFVEPGHWFVGGRSLPEHRLASAFVEVRITDETNTKQEKADYVAAVYQALQQRLGPLHEVSYVQVQDVRAAAWGFGGVTQEARPYRD
jgi:4-oxalocrotonate tautomerase